MASKLIVKLVTVRDTLDVLNYYPIKRQSWLIQREFTLTSPVEQEDPAVQVVETALFQTLSR